MIRLRTAAVSMLLGAIASVCLVRPAIAETTNFSCMMTASEAADFIKMGYTDNPKQVVYISPDLSASTVLVWESAPGFPKSRSDGTTYPATITSDLVTWEIPADEYSAAAKRSFDRHTNLLTTFDPTGEPFYWNCTSY
jgi:hypothetical protein